MNNLIWKKRCIISPSLISCFDMCNLERDLRIVESSGIEVLHIDILDGHFSPSMPLGLDAVKALRKLTDIMLDVHLMSTNNQYFINELIKIGVDQIVFHQETEPHIDGTINKIHNAGIRAGIALKPSTSLSTLDYVIEKCNAVLLMLINPGYASSAAESQVTYAERKIKDLRKKIDIMELDTTIELDGRIAEDTLRLYGNGTADLFVAGSTCLNRVDLTGSIHSLINLRESILQMK